jgi:putative flippase GtrA
MSHNLKCDLKYDVSDGLSCDASAENFAVTNLCAHLEEPSRRRSPSRLVRWLKFNFVGGIGIAIQFAALFSLKAVVHLDYLAATAVAVEAAVLHNFVWHEQFTWADRWSSANGESGHNGPWSKRSLGRLLRFQIANGTVSLAGNLALMKVLVGAGHMNYLAANAIAIALCSVANFLVSDEWVFA